ncbi:MAG: hypothetical protein IJW53_01005 [Clostridia bacterium]|nr:hypothetical protein [Clostridia bacterium]
MVDVINLILLIVALILIVRFILWSRKRIVMIIRLKSLQRELGAEVKFLRFPLLPTRTSSQKPDLYVKILNTVYLIRLYSGGNKHHMVHFSSERFSVRYMKMAMRMLTSSKRRATGLAYVESGKAFTVSSKVFVSRPLELPDKLATEDVKVEKILLFNPAPHAVSYVLPEKTGIKVALTGDEVFGMKIYTGSSFVEYAKRQAREGDKTNN